MVFMSVLVIFYYYRKLIWPRERFCPALVYFLFFLLKIFFSKYNE